MSSSQVDAAEPPRPIACVRNVYCTAERVDQLVVKASESRLPPILIIRMAEVGLCSSKLVVVGCQCGLMMHFFILLFPCPHRERRRGRGRDRKTERTRRPTHKHTHTQKSANIHSLYTMAYTLVRWEPLSLSSVGSYSIPYHQSSTHPPTTHPSTYRLQNAAHGSPPPCSGGGARIAACAISPCVTVLL